MQRQQKYLKHHQKIFISTHELQFFHIFRYIHSKILNKFISNMKLVLISKYNIFHTARDAAYVKL